MDDRRFDSLARLLAAQTVRRDVFPALLAAVLGATVGQEIGYARLRRGRPRRTRTSRTEKLGNGPPCANRCRPCSPLLMGSGADLRGCDFKELILTKRDLSGSTLRGACLQGSDLREANLDGADLGGACLENALLNQSTLRGATLKDAVLCGANLTRADLSGARVSSDQLECALVCSTTLPDGSVGDDDRGTSRLCPVCDGACAKDQTCCGNACANLDVSIKHCARCDNTCPPPTPHVSVTCGEAPDLHGRLVHDCVYTCESGWEDCDDDFDTGCEVFTRGDVANCGGCGTRCGEGMVCCNCACVPEGSGACGVCPTLTSGRLIRRR